MRWKCRTGPQRPSALGVRPPQLCHAGLSSNCRARITASRQRPVAGWRPIAAMWDLTEDGGLWTLVLINAPRKYQSNQWCRAGRGGGYFPRASPSTDRRASFAIVGRWTAQAPGSPVSMHNATAEWRPRMDNTYRNDSNPDSIDEVEHT